MMLTLPLYVDLSRKKGKPKRVYLNLNIYRNTHFHINNEIKQVVKRNIWDQLSEMEDTYLTTPVKVTVTLYTFDKRDRDLGNICPIVQKFCDDAVVEFGSLPDDSVKYIKRIEYVFGGVDTNNPRAEISYESI